jgi:thiol:disulfide interchange protein DsbC
MDTLFIYLTATWLGLAAAVPAQAQQMAAPARIDFASLPLQRAIKVVHGNGARRLAVFSDPDCPYCQLLERDTLERLDNVTIYTFLFPLARHGDAARKSQLIWCAPDPALAWQEWMRYRKLPAARACVPPLRANLTLANKLGIRVTPTLILPQGEAVLGAIDAETLEGKLGETP